MSEKNTDWTTPFYLQFLQGNFVVQMKGDEQKWFVALVKQAIAEIDDQAIAGLLSGGSWREKLSGGWFAGLTGRIQFQKRIGELLVQSSSCFSGQGYCFALAAFSNEQSSALLKGYLDKWLLRLDCEYDQDWAMAALIWVDKQRGTEFSKLYLAPEGLWEKFASDKTKIPEFKRWHLDVRTEQFANLMSFCGEYFGVSRK
jgi:hypothetical protein